MLQFSQANKTKMLDIIKLISSIKPIESLAWVSSKIEYHLKFTPDASELDRKYKFVLYLSIEYGYLTLKSKFYLTFRGDSTLLVTILSSLSKSLLQKESNDTETVKIGSKI